MTTGTQRTTASRQQTTALALATFAFATNFWAWGLLAGGFVLGLSGASFAIGIPFVSRWYPPERRGFALGVYGVGNVGTAIAGFASPPLAASLSTSAPFLVVAVVVLCTAAVFSLFGRDAPGRTADPTPFLPRIGDALRLRITADLAALYAITFGGFVAFGVYLPTCLTQVYGLETTDAGARAAGFIMLATVARPVGGWLSDRLGGGSVLTVALAVVAAGAAVVAFTPGIVLATVAFLSMAAALGVGNGAVFALVGTRAPATKVGAVTGFVGAAAGSEASSPRW